MTSDVASMSDDKDEAVEERGVYEALYTKYRPQRFSDVVGQGSAKLLLDLLQKDKLPHAIMLQGPSGTGKTTVARLVAASLNCDDRGPDCEPCGRCSMCRSVLAGTGRGDIPEVNCAQHRGVDTAREIAGMTNLSSFNSYRVFILDEAHQLTREAQSALLNLNPPT